MLAQTFQASESLGYWRGKWENRPGGVNRGLLIKGAMGLRMKKQSVPEMMWVLRLVAAAASGVYEDKISWMINGCASSGYGHTLRDYVMAVVILPFEPDWLIDRVCDIHHRGWAVT